MIDRSPRVALRYSLSLLAAIFFGASSTRAVAADEADAEITYTKHIAPILWKNCAACHRPGEVGPFSLLTYKDAAKRADFIAEITASRRMPPWKAEPNFGKFRDERRLSERDIERIAQWVEAGAPEGDPQDLPKPPKFPEGWQLGEPDLVLKMEAPFSVPAGGPDVYRCFIIPIPLDSNKMVSAVEFRPGNARVVHHAIMFLDANGNAKALDGVDGKPGFPSFGGPGIKPTGGLGAWVPGTMPRFLPEGLVKYVRKGSDVVLQVHYHPSGKREQDQSVIGIHFSKKPVTKVVTGIAVLQPKLLLPAGDAHCQVTCETQPLPANVNVLGISPHMHNLGREFKVTAKMPNGSGEIPLIWIKDWDFNWQGSYQFEKPVRLPRGATINVSSIYDNSSGNPKNPHNPPKTIRWGEQTTDEMCLCGVQVFADKPGDLKLIAEMAGNELGAGLEGGIPGQAEDVKKKAIAQKVAARKTAEKEETARKLAVRRGTVAPAAETDEVATADAEEAPAAKSKPAPKAEPKFPAGGVPIPEKAKFLLNQYDKNGDGKFSQEEFANLPADFQRLLKKDVQQQLRAEGGGKETPAAEEPKKKPLAKQPAAKAAAEPAVEEPAAEADEAPEAAPVAKTRKPALRTTGKAGGAFPAGGVPIPEGTIRPLFDEYDVDDDEKLSREEFDALPDLLKKQFPASYRRAAPAAEAELSEDEVPSAAEDAEPPKIKAIAKKPAAAPARAKKEVAAAEEEAPAEEPEEPALPKPRAKTASKTAASDEKPFPAGGLAISDALRPMISNFDVNRDGKLSYSEYDKLPARLKVKFPGKYAKPGATATAKATAETKKKPVTKKPAPKPAPEEMVEEEAAATDAAPEGAESEPAKEAPATPAKAKDEFPAEGVAIPENVKFLLNQYDGNKDGRLSKDEFEKIPEGIRNLLKGAINK